MIVSIIGARPQFVKAAVVSKALNKIGVKEIIVHTGQHYDDNMSKVFWNELDIPAYATNLGAGSGMQGAQTAFMIEKLEVFITELPEPPKAILLYGDTNSTLAGSIVASKLNIPIVHVEAGLRSFNREMPEEINRIVTDHLSTLLFCSSESSSEQLSKEGIKNGVYVTGDVMYDAVKMFSEVAGQKVNLEEVLPFSGKKFYLLTLHRPSNTENEANLNAILSSLGKLDGNVLWPVHPRLKSRVGALNLPGNIKLVDPLSYFQMLQTLNSCEKVFTDSGGLQKEAYWLRKPCITLRTETEWIETLHNSWNILTGPDSLAIEAASSKKVDPASWKELYGNGNASGQIAEIIKAHFY